MISRQTSGIVVKMALFLGLDLHDTFYVVLMLEIGSSSSQSVHAGLDAYCLQLSAIKIVSWPSYIIEKIPSSTKLISLWFIFLEWILRIWPLASSLGRGNSIFLSSLPDLIKAGSRTSGRLVAQMTLMSSLGEKLNYYFFTRPNGWGVTTWFSALICLLTYRYQIVWFR